MSSKTKAVLALSSILIVITLFSHPFSPKRALRKIQASLPTAGVSLKPKHTIFPTTTDTPIPTASTKFVPPTY